MMKYILILFLCAAAGMQTYAQEKMPPAGKKVLPRIRAGVIQNANFSTSRPESFSPSPAAGKSSPAWAELTLILDPGRAVSIFDYALRKDGTEYPCLDMADGQDAFQGRKRNYSDSQSGRRCRLLFAVPSADDEYEIVFKLLPGEEDPVKLNEKAPPPPEPAAETAAPGDRAASENGKSGEKASGGNACNTPASAVKDIIS